MVDKNSKLVSRINEWSDFDFSFNINPNTSNLLLKKDVESVKQSLKNLLLTRKGERPFSPNYGSNLYNFLFDPIDIVTETLIREEISTSIRNYEPRVNLLNVLVEEEGKNFLRISVECEIINPDRNVFNFNLLLERIR